MIDNEQLEQETNYAIGPDEDFEEEIPADGEKIERADLMEVTGRLIRHLDKKSITGRLQKPDTEKMRDSKTRLLIEAVKVHGGLLKDEALDAIEDRIKRLEERLL